MIRYFIIFTLLAMAATGCRKKENNATPQKGLGHGGHGHAHDAPSLGSATEALSELALRNLGVVIKEVDSSDYVVSRPVAASIQETPFNERPLNAPFPGRIKSISVTLGEYLNPGKTVVEIVRDPIPRAELSLVEELLKPASDKFHDTISELRKARVELVINDRERARLKKIQGDANEPLIAKQTLLELDYKSERLAQDISNLRAKLNLHGFTSAEIDGMEKGKDPVFSKNLWLSALKQSGIWSPKSETIFKALPGTVKNNQWAIATIGELTAEGLVNNELTDFLTETPSAGAHVIEIGGLLQRGSSLAEIRDLHRLGAFAPVITVKTPLDKDWDVEKVHVKVGQVVERGTPLVTLSNHQTLYLSGFPVGSEIAAINSAIKQDQPFAAIPLTPGTGPTLSNLHVSKIQGQGGRGTRVLLPVKNSPEKLTEVDGRQFRNWQLRSGMQYILQVPEKVLEDVIVLPSEAVVDYGNEKVIYVREEGTFSRRKVAVAHRDDRVVVLGEGSEVFPDEPMVVEGAFSLSLALRAKGGDNAGADAHAGCDHD